MRKTSLRRRDLPADQAAPLPVVGDAAIATHAIGDGRLVPLVIVDASTRPDVVEMIRIHEHFSSGDVKTSWGQRDVNSNSVMLILEFERPVEQLIVIEFDIVRQGGLVDQVIRSRAIYIQPGVAGDRLMNTMDHRRILIQIPDSGFDERWDELLHAHLAKSFRRQRGLSGKQRAENLLGKSWRSGASSDA